MKGDYVKVTYRTGAGTESVEITARVDGYKLSWAEPRDKDRFMTVEVQNRNGGKVEEHLFASADVVAVTSGHKTAMQMASKPRAPRKPKVTQAEIEASGLSEQDPE
jgi:hypothetical protein